MPKLLSIRTPRSASAVFAVVISIANKITIEIRIKKINTAQSNSTLRRQPRRLNRGSFKHPQELRDKCVELYNQGQGNSSRAVAKEFNVGKTTVLNWSKQSSIKSEANQSGRSGIPKRPPVQKINFSADGNKAIKDKVIEGRFKLTIDSDR